jgi:hypothetical protein
MSPLAIHCTALRSKSGSAPWGPNWRAPQLEGEMPGADDGQKAPGILSHTQEARTTSQQSCRNGSLKGIWCAVECQAGGNRGRSKAVVGECDQYRLEDTHLWWRWSPLGGQPERQFAESHLAEQIVRQIVAEELDAGRR